jgi:hypothetical protein
MVRRARQSPKPGLLWAGLAAVLLAIGIAAYFLGSSKTPYRTAPDFPVEDYLSTSTTLRGNSYRLSGAVLNSIAWSPDEGRLVSVKPNGSESPIPVVIPPSLGETNIEKGQRFHILVEVRDGGILYATGITKS